MGILDAPPLTRHQADARYGQLGSNAAALMNRLEIGQENAALLVLGDSTGVGTTRWVYLTAQWLATSYPAYTVKWWAWDDGTQAYDTAAVIQTGTGTGNAGGPYVLDVYNGSVSGSAASYPLTSTTRFAAMAPATPQLVIINYSHNSVGQTPTGYRYTHYQVCRVMQEHYPQAGILLVAQNPRAATDSEYAAGLRRCRTVADLAATEGYGLVDVTRLFLANPTYADDYLNPDGLHPNDATGSPLWAREVEKHLQAGVQTVPRGAPLRQNRIWLPAATWTAFSGSPVLALVNSEAPMWSMPATVDTAICASVDIPAHWESFDTYVFWTTAAGSGFTISNNTSRWALLRQNQGYTFTGPPLAGTLLTPGSYLNPGTVSGSANNLGAYSTFVAQTNTQSTPSGSNPIGLQLRRVGTDVLDTITTQVFVLGVLLARAA